MDHKLKQYPKSEVGFEHPAKNLDEVCKDCIHFQILHKNGCERVKGYIEANDYCKRFFERKARFAKKMNEGGK